MRRILALSFLALGALSSNAQKKPNIICILADDIGYQDLSCYGARKISTPNLDNLAANGIRFTNAYSPASTSSPSRYAMLTGEYAWRKNVGILPADAPLSISQDNITWPKIMKRLGYNTAIVGKWHLGVGEKGTPVDFNSSIKAGPLAVGFDYCYYFPGTNDRVPCVFIEQDKVVGLDSNDPIQVSYKRKVGDWPTGKENPEKLVLKHHLGHNNTIINGIGRIGWMTGGKSALWNDETMAEDLCNKAIEYIKDNKKEPFFLYYAPQNAHEPRVPSRQFRGKSKAGIYGDVIEEFDYCVGRVIQCLKDEGLYDNTIIIVSSDNAPMIKEGYDDGALENINGHNPYGNLRGEKYSLHEGGTKVPFIFSWPDRIKEPFLQEQPFCYMDLMATIPSLIGHKLDKNNMVDTEDASELFIKENAGLYRLFICTQNNGGDLSLRMGKWKFIPGKPGVQAELYNLEEDPSEIRNVNFAYPQIAWKFRQYIKTLNKK